MQYVFSILQHVNCDCGCKMSDIDIAKTELYEEKLTLAIVKDGKILFATKSHRISGFLDAIDEIGTSLEGSSVADRVVGKAIALLCAYAKIGEVYAVVLSRKALGIIKKHKIKVQWKDLVDNVLDISKTEVCPFEKASVEISEPIKAYSIFKDLRRNLQACK